MKPYRRDLSKQQKRAIRIRTGHGRRYHVSPRRRRKLARAVGALARWSAAVAGLNAIIAQAVTSMAAFGRAATHTGGIVSAESMAGTTVRIRRDTVVCPAGSAELRRGLDAARQRLGPSRGGGVIVIDRQRIDADSGLTATAEPFRRSRPLDSAN